MLDLDFVAKGLQLRLNGDSHGGPLRTRRGAEELEVEPLAVFDSDAVGARQPAGGVEHLFGTRSIGGLHVHVGHALIRREHAAGDRSLTGQANGQQRGAIDRQRRGFADGLVVERRAAVVDDQIILAPRGHRIDRKVWAGQRFDRLRRHTVDQIDIARAQREHACVGIRDQPDGEFAQGRNPVPVLREGVGIELLTDRNVRRLVCTGHRRAVLVNDEELG